MRTRALTALAVGLLRCISSAAEANIFRNLAAVSLVRERSGEFGYDTSGYSDEEILDFIRTIPCAETEEFIASYARRPDEGTQTTAALERVNRIEFDREKELVGRWIGAWEARRSERRARPVSSFEPEDSFAFNF